MNMIMDELKQLVKSAGIKYWKDKENERLLAERLNDYIERQADKNESSTMAEEVDFQGLADYFTSTWLEDVYKYVFGAYGEREEIKKTIYAKAYEYARARGSVQESKVEIIVNGALDVIKSYYREKIDDEKKYIIAEITDNLKDISDDYKNEIKGSIKSILEQNKEELIKEMQMLTIENNKKTYNEKGERENDLFRQLHDFVMRNYIKQKYRDDRFREQNLDTYSDLFKLFAEIYHNDKMICVDKNIFDFVREDILTQEKGNLIKIVGPDGTGKSTFLSLLYIYLYGHCRKNGFSFYPFYINLHYYDQMLGTDSPNAESVKQQMDQDLGVFKEIVTVFPDIPYIVIIDGNEDYFKTTLKTAKTFNEFVSKISGHKKIVCIGEKTNVHSYRERKNYTFMYKRMLYTFKFRAIRNTETEKRKKFIQYYAAIENNRYFSDAIMSYLAKFDLNELDLNILNMFKACYERDVLKKVDSVSDLYKNYCVAYLGDEDDFENSAKMSFEYFMTGKIFSQDEISSNNQNWNLIHQHKTISNFLIAHYYVEKLKNYSAEKDIAELEYLFPMEVNIFIKSLINDGHDMQRVIFAHCREVYEKGGIIVKSQMLYMMGRITNKNMKPEIIGTLEGYYKELKGELMQETGAKSEIDDREIHLLLRSLIISLVYLGEKDKREEYLNMLLNYSVANQINRGFHLEYYGDISRTPNNRSYGYYDDGSEPMDMTYEVLLKRVNRYLSSIRGREDLNFQINLFTLCSLIQARLGTKNLPEDCIPTVMKIIESTLQEEETNISIDLKAYLVMLYEDIKNNTYMPGCLYDKLYGVKGIVRKGWEQEIKNTIPVPSYENVAEHIYYTWMLGMIYLPEIPPKEERYELYDKEKILHAILIHDWAEIDVGDAVPKENTEEHKKLEDFRMRILLMHDTYKDIGNMLQYKNAWNVYGKSSDDINGQIAYELDKIQALYQFYQYLDQDAEFTEDKKADWRREANKVTTSIGQQILREVVLDRFGKK